MVRRLVLVRYIMKEGLPSKSNSFHHSKNTHTLKLESEPLAFPALTSA
jgi:hypothetical protein